RLPVLRLAVDEVRQDLRAAAEFHHAEHVGHRAVIAGRRLANDREGHDRAERAEVVLVELVAEAARAARARREHPLAAIAALRSDEVDIPVGIHLAEGTALDAEDGVARASSARGAGRRYIRHDCLLKNSLLRARPFLGP